MRASVVFAVLIAACGTDPAQLLTARANTWSSLAIDDHDLYWTFDDPSAGPCPMNGMIMQAPIDGGDEIELASNQLCPRDLVLRDGQLYWTSGGNTAGQPGGVWTMPATGGTPEMIVTDQYASYRLAIDDSNAYWTSNEDSTVYQAPLGGGSPVMLDDGDESSGEGIAVDASSVYWTVPLADSYGYGAIRKAPIGGGPVTALVEGLGGGDDALGSWPSGIAVDGDTVYWVAVDEVARIPADGGAMEVLASGSWASQAFALDATDVYWNDAVSGQLMKVSRDGGAIAIVSPYHADGIGLALDASYAYVTGADGIFRVPR